MATTWGMTAVKPDAPPRNGTYNRSTKAKLPPQAAREGHRGIVWLHASAVAIWLLVAGVLGALLLAGKPVPPVVIIACAGAAAGHALFLATHLFLAAAAQRRATLEKTA